MMDKISECLCGCLQAPKPKTRVEFYQGWMGICGAVFAQIDSPTWPEVRLLILGQSLVNWSLVTQVTPLLSQDCQHHCGTGLVLYSVDSFLHCQSEATVLNTADQQERPKRSRI